LQGVERAEYCGVAKPLGNAARVKAVDAIGPVMVVDDGLDRDINVHAGNSQLIGVGEYLTNELGIA
jgi:hypothetical protein